MSDFLSWMFGVFCGVTLAGVLVQYASGSVLNICRDKVCHAQLCPDGSAPTRAYGDKCLCVAGEAK